MKSSTYMLTRLIATVLMLRVSLLHPRVSLADSPRPQSSFAPSSSTFIHATASPSFSL